MYSEFKMECLPFEFSQTGDFDFCRSMLWQPKFITTAVSGSWKRFLNGFEVVWVLAPETVAPTEAVLVAPTFLLIPLLCVLIDAIVPVAHCAVFAIRWTTTCKASLGINDTAINLLILCETWYNRCLRVFLARQGSCFNFESVMMTLITLFASLLERNH